MKRKLFLALALPLNLLAGCASAPSSEGANDKITVTDMLGDSIAIQKNPSKVACISRTTYDLLVAFGLGDKIDGAYSGTLNNKWVNVIYPEASSAHVYGYDDSYETFLSRGVDLVFSPEKYLSDGLKEHGINSLCVSLYGNPTFDNYVYFFADLVTEIWDYPEVKTKAEKWKKDVKEAISSIQTELGKHEITKRKLFYIRGDKDKGVGYTDQASAFTEYAYRTLGFEVLGASMDTNKPSAEEIMQASPDVFVAGGIYQNKNLEALKQEPYCNLDAVKNGQYYNIPIGFTAFEQLSVMTPVFFYDQANKLYPDYFHYDIASMVKTTIRDGFGAELSDAQVGYMLKGLGPSGEELYR